MEDNRSTAFSLSRRIGSTNYRVKVFFSETETETLEDKILKLRTSFFGYSPPCFSFHF